MSKPGKSLKALCKKLGVRLTVKRGNKRVYKSVKVLKEQCKRKKKKKVKRRRRKFGSGPEFWSPPRPRGSANALTPGQGGSPPQYITSPLFLSPGSSPSGSSRRRTGIIDGPPPLFSFDGPPSPIPFSFDNSPPPRFNLGDFGKKKRTKKVKKRRKVVKKKKKSKRKSKK